MIGYITIGSNDLSVSTPFFDQLFSRLNGKRIYSLDTMVGYSFGDGSTMIIVTKPFDGGHATPGNGAMIALLADTRSQVDEVHALALELGAKDEGTPGMRNKHFYSGYFRDPDGNKFNIHLKPE